MDPLSSFPDEFRAGTTLKVRREYSDYPADDGWTATLTVYGAATIPGGVAVDGAGYIFTLAATATDTEAPPGTYRYVVQASKAGEVYEAEAGIINILRSLTGLAGNAGQSENEKNLALVNAMLAGKLASDMQSYQIAGRALSRYTFDELLKLKAALETAVGAERDPGRAMGGEVLVNFTPVGGNS